MKNSLVSIIVPVYNVEKYIDQCLESICSQTYENIEVILVYDESSDNCLLKCKQWALKDKRIKLIVNQKRNGLGAARNLGLKTAVGKYIVYLDSDDWMEKNYVDVLYKAIESTGANYVSSIGFYTVNQEGTIRKAKTLPSGEYSSNDDRILVLLREAPAVWKKIYNREWLIKNNLFQPELFHYEDWGYDIGLILQTEKITLIPQIGVFYRVARDGNLGSDNLEAICSDFEKTIEFGLIQVEQKGILQQYKTAIQKYIFQNYCMRRNMALSIQNGSALKILEKIKTDILIKQLGCRDIGEKERHICFGSFSLYWSVQAAYIFVGNIEYYGFSNLISAITPGPELDVKNENIFRVSQVSNDIEGIFGGIFDSIEDETILFLDFLEDRNFVLEIGNGQYVTGSEAYYDSIVRDISVKRIVNYDMEEFHILWEKKCDDLIEKLKQKQKLLDIILVKNRLALRHGDMNATKIFGELEKLESINRMVSNHEQIFLDKCECVGLPVKIIDLPEKYCFTDEEFRYGCVPQYMNEALYTYVGYEIFKRYGE